MTRLLSLLIGVEHTRVGGRKSLQGPNKVPTKFLQRSMDKQAKHIYEFGPFNLDANERVLLRNGVPVSLAPKAIETLILLVQNSGHIVEKDELMKTVWPDAFVEEAGLTRNVSVLRKVLGEDSGDSQYIETVPKRGYRFAVAVKELREGSDLVIRRRARVRIVTEEEIDDDDRLVDYENARTIRLKAAERTIAVLPFVNAGGNPDAEYLSDGITDSIINNLSQLPQLRVMARSTAFCYKGREADPRDVGQELGVGAVLVGRVLQFSERLIIRTALVDVDNGFQLWGEQYNREPVDIFAVQEEIAKEITENLRLTLTEKERRLLTKRYTENTEAYHLYLKGRFYANMRTPDDLNRGLEYFQQAIEIDPLYAPAYAGVADCHANMGYMFGRVPPTEAIPKAKAASLHALEIDNTLAEAYTSLGLVNFTFDWDMKSARDHFEHSIALNPNLPAARHMYGSYLCTVLGRHDEAIAEARKGLELDPLSLPLNHIVGFLQLMARRPYDAITRFRKTLELIPAHPLVRHSMGAAFEYQAKYEKAVEEFLRGNPFLSQSEEDVNELRRAFTDAGWKGFLQKLQTLSLAQWQRNGPWHGDAFNIASNYARLGDVESALEWLELAYEMRSGLLIWLRVHFHFDALRQDARFVELLRRVGLANGG